MNTSGNGEKAMRRDEYGDCGDCTHIVIWMDESGYEQYGCDYRHDIENGCPDFEEVKE